MCQRSGDARHVDERVVARRGFLKIAGGAALGFAAVGRVFAEEAKRPPKPENVVSPDVTLERFRSVSRCSLKDLFMRHRAAEIDHGSSAKDHHGTT